MKTRKHQCRIQLAASEPVAYRLVFSIFKRKHRIYFVSVRNPYCC